MVIELTLTILLIVLLTCLVLMVIQLTLTILLIVLLTCLVDGDSTHTHNLTHCFADMFC
jgi:hypothetical protein